MFALLFLFSEHRFVDFGNFPTFFSFPQKLTLIMFFLYYLSQLTLSGYQGSALLLILTFSCSLVTCTTAKQIG